MLKIEVLRKDHDRKAFDCRVEELNQYLRNIARQHTITEKSFRIVSSIYLTS